MDRAARGFSLLEVLVATTLVTVALSSLAQLLLIATRANAKARTTTYAVVLAQQKMEQLRALTYGFDVVGQPLTDTTTDITVVPERAFGGTGLTASPPGALDANTVGYVEYLDANGRSLGGSSAAPPVGTIYTRRWSIVPLAANPGNAIVIQVLVTRSLNRSEARLVSVKTRKAA